MSDVFNWRLLGSLSRGPTNETWFLTCEVEVRLAPGLEVVYVLRVGGDEDVVLLGLRLHGFDLAGGPCVLGRQGYRACGRSGVRGDEGVGRHRALVVGLQACAKVGLPGREYLLL